MLYTEKEKTEIETGTRCLPTTSNKARILNVLV